MKILFVLNKNQFGGGEISLTTLINALPATVSYDIIMRCNYFGKNPIEKIRNLYKRAGNITFMPLPCNTYWKERSKTLELLRDSIKNFLWLFSKQKYRTILKNGQYDVIHLNSYILNKMITNEKNFIYHVRTLNDRIGKSSISRLRHATAIFIDETVAKTFKKYGLNGHVIENPINVPQSDVQEIKNIRAKYSALKKGFIIGMFGYLSESKGNLFVLQTFLEHAPQGATLLIVGSGDAGTEKKIALYSNNKVVHHIPHVEYSEIGNLYAICDAIICGEAQYQVGRTVYEALAVGKCVIIPGTDSDLIKNPKLLEHKDKINFYRARNKKDAGIIMSRIIKKGKSSHNTKRESASVDLKSYLDIIKQFSADS